MSWKEEPVMGDQPKKSVTFDIYSDTTPDEAVSSMEGALNAIGATYKVIYDDEKSGGWPY